MPGPEDFLTHLARSPIGADLQREIDAARLTDRKDIVETLAKLSADIEKAYPAANAAVEKTAARVKKLQQDLNAARVEHSQAVSARASISSRFSQARLDLEKQLADTASPLIADAREWVHAEFRAARKSLRTSYHAETNAITGVVSQRCETNADRVNTRIVGLNAMFDALAHLALEADQSNVGAIIEKMKAEIGGI